MIENALGVQDILFEILNQRPLNPPARQPSQIALDWVVLAKVPSWWILWPSILNFKNDIFKFLMYDFSPCKGLIKSNFNIILDSFNILWQRSAVPKEVKIPISQINLKLFLKS